ncbi:MAG: hypothetical protein CME60_02110 [Halobacteriovoraceae bacterium]|nr:hypothetical protein [Halobacteriovoraceae bacterium]|tara:strand:- start:212 stop:871 length:660 start_codon:yes stop_codon:yes gene_type:complete
MDINKYAQNLKEKVTHGKFDGSRLPSPKDQTGHEALLQTNLPLYLEIGCGAGLHPVLFAKNNMNSHLLAFERTKEKFEKFLRRVTSHQLKNVTPIYEDALNWLYPKREIFQHQFSGLFLLYPNPYPKNSQRNKRFLASSSFQFLLSLLKAEANIEIRSNELWYLEEAIFLAENVWDLKNEGLIKVRELDQIQQGLTHFERKYLKEGQDCWQLTLSQLLP